MIDYEIGHEFGSEVQSKQKIKEPNHCRLLAQLIWNQDMHK